MSWFQKCFRQGFQNIGGPDLASFDARKMVESWKERGAELVYMDAIHQVETLFPTPFSLLSPHLGGRDLVREFTDACRDTGIRPGVYITPLEHTPFSQDKPEWCQTKTDGSLHGGPGWAGTPNYWACWNSPFLDKMCELIADLFSRYPLEAAFFDGLLSRHGVCHCPSCAAKFKADTGHDLPGAHNLEDPAFREYLRWKGRTLAEATRRVIAATRVRNPHVEAVSNTPAAWCNWCATQPPEFFDATENVCVEAFPGILNPLTPGIIHTSDIGTMAFSIGYTRGQARGFPKVQAYSWVGVLNFSIAEDVRLETKAALALGGLPCVQGFRPAQKEAYDFVRSCEPYLVDSKPVLWAALAASQESCDTQFVGDGPSGAYFEDLRGTYAAMVDTQLPVEFISGRALGEESLSEVGQASRLPAGKMPAPPPYAVLVLSDVGYMTEKQTEAVREFVRAGGGLVATARTSLIGVDGKPQADFALADVLGVHAAPTPPWPTVSSQMQTVQAAIEFDDAPWWGDAAEPTATPECGWTASGEQSWVSSGRGHLVIAPFQAVSVVIREKGAKVRAWLRPVAVEADRTIRLPGIVESRFGKGRVVYLCNRIGETYSRHPFELWRRLLREAVTRVAARPPAVEVRAPLCVTQHAWEQAEHNRWVVHLINDLDEAGRPRNRLPGEHDQGKNHIYGCAPRNRTIPIHDVDVIIRKPGATKAALPLEGRDLAVRKVRDGIKVRIRRLEQHAMIVVS